MPANDPKQYEGKFVAEENEYMPWPSDIVFDARDIATVIKVLNEANKFTLKIQVGFGQSGNSIPKVM